MDRKSALATAAGLVLVVAGAASALTSAWTQPSTAASATPTVVTEYVDQFGNPVAPPSQAQSQNVVLTRSPQGQVVFAGEPAIVPAAPVLVTAVGSGSVVSHESDGEHESEDGDR